MLQERAFSNSSPKGALAACEVAAICKEVGFHRPSPVRSTSVLIFKGLAYMHNELRLYHGDLHRGNILFSRSGNMKIGNAPQSKHARELLAW